MSLRLSLLLVMVFSGAASAADPCAVLPRVPPSPAACQLAALSGPITLAHAVGRALCANPATRSAWPASRLRAAEPGQADSAYLPEVSLNGSLARNGDSMLPNVTPRGKPALRRNTCCTTSALAAFKAADARVNAGTATPVDRLQAKTLHTQRQSERDIAAYARGRIRFQDGRVVEGVAQAEVTA